GTSFRVLEERRSGCRQAYRGTGTQASSPPTGPGHERRVAWRCLTPFGSQTPITRETPITHAPICRAPAFGSDGTLPLPAIRRKLPLSDSRRELLVSDSRRVSDTNHARASDTRDRNQRLPRQRGSRYGDASMRCLRISAQNARRCLLDARAAWATLPPWRDNARRKYSRSKPATTRDLACRKGSSASVASCACNAAKAASRRARVAVRRAPARAP